MNYVRLKYKTTIFASDKSEIESAINNKWQIVSCNLAEHVVNRFF